ncbi:hypothetical protein [Zavarzinella formosa]|uniref:hypothetical protein n=1 Tax=Zavarzinella formosa TaxID=360055 RepID=UPI0002FC1E5C|nr:hypothetical protein [Zavarzinella formosa]
MDISPAVDLALLYNPKLAYKDIVTIKLWLNDGADMDKDILPTMKQLMGKNPHIGTFSYFTNAIFEARIKRESLEPLKAVEKDPDFDRRKAVRMAWVRDRCSSIRIPSHEAKWLEEYEAVHGKVKA